MIKNKRLYRFTKINDIGKRKNECIKRDPKDLFMW